LLSVGGGAADGLSNSQRADLNAYDEAVRSLELSQQRRRGLLVDLESMQHEVRTLEGDILTKTAAADRMRHSLSAHRTSHGKMLGLLDSRIREIDHASAVASRPHLRTADRFSSTR